MPERRIVSLGKLLAAGWTIVLAGLAGAIISFNALQHGGHMLGLLPILVVVIPYLAGGMLLHITRKARIVICALLLPALFDVGAAFAYSFGTDPAWDVELKWRFTRVGLLGLVSIPFGLGFGMWLERCGAHPPE